MMNDRDRGRSARFGRAAWWSLLTLAALLISSPRADAAAADLWPLETGNRWVLACEDDAGDVVELRVAARERGWSILDTPLGRLHVWASGQSGNVLVWDAAARGVGRWLDFEASAPFRMELPGSLCLNASRWKIEARGRSFETPAGRFDRCVVLVRDPQGGGCESAPLERVAFAPGTGPVLWERSCGGGRLRYRLREAVVGGRHVSAPPPPVPAPFLPERFSAQVEGVGGSLWVEAKRLVLVGLPPAPGAGVRRDRLARLAERFLSLNVPKLRPQGVEPRLAIYRLENADGRRFWAGNGSLGSESRERILAAVRSRLPFAPAGGQPSAFRSVGTLERLVLGGRWAGDLAAAADNLAALLMALNADAPERAPLDLEVFELSRPVGEFGHRRVRAVLVDPTALSGPEPFAYLVIWVDGTDE